jgi:DNA-binding NtrC family response regulator
MTYATLGQNPTCNATRCAEELARIFTLLSTVAATPAPVFLEAGRGQGTELIARAIHRRSLRAGCNFVVARCGLVPPAVLDRNLLGGATNSRSFVRTRQPWRVGEIDAAQGGTLYIDQLQHVSPRVQARLMEVMCNENTDDQSWLMPPGIRIVASGTQISERVRGKAFRADLWHRLGAVTVRLPRGMESASHLADAVERVERWIEGEELNYWRTASRDLCEFVRQLRRLLDAVREAA